MSPRQKMPVKARIPPKAIPGRRRRIKADSRRVGDVFPPAKGSAANEVVSRISPRNAPRSGKSRQAKGTASMAEMT
mgnify:CR=1 FL=1